MSDLSVVLFDLFVDVLDDNYTRIKNQHENMFLLNICQPADIILLKSFLNNWKVGVFSN